MVQKLLICYLYLDHATLVIQQCVILQSVNFYSYKNKRYLVDLLFLKYYPLLHQLFWALVAHSASYRLGSIPM